jgi:hypothetical protein
LTFSDFFSFRALTFADFVFLQINARLTTLNVMKSLEYVLLALDELVDGGTILEIEGSAIAARVSMRSTTADVPLHEQTPGQAFSSIKEQMQRHFKLPTT